MSTILAPIYDAVSWVLVTFHTLLTKLGLGPDSGLTWTLSIVLLVVLIRIILIPLFVKQIKAQRGLQALQPQIKEIQKKYKNDRERQSQEMMKLYRETGTNPLSSCLPLIAQSPIFFGLFHVLNGVAHNPQNPPGVFTPALAESMANATFFGAPLSSTFLGAGSTSTKIVIGVMVVLMSTTMFLTQRQLMMKNMPADSLQGNPFAQQQKMLLYIMPAIFLFSGLGFPIGVLLYWVTSNLWTAGQQFYVIRNNPTPGTKAYEEFQARKAAKGTAPAGGTSPKGGPRGLGRRGAPSAGEGGAAGASGTSTGATVADDGAEAAAATSGQRQQPKRTSRSKRPKAGGPRPAAPSSEAGSPDQAAGSDDDAAPRNASGNPRRRNSA